MRGFNNDKLWHDFEASGCVGDYLNYRVSKITMTKNTTTQQTNIDKTNTKDSYNGLKDNRCCAKTTQSW